MPGDAAPGADAGVVRVLSPSAVHSSLEAIVAAHRARGGGAVELAFETAPALAQRLAAGEAADIVIAPPQVMEVLVGAGRTDSAGRFQVGRAGVGVCVRDGAPVPDVGSVAELTRALLDADAIFHTQASSGIYVARLLERLGVSVAAGARIQAYRDAQETFSRLLASPGRDLGLGGIPEIRRWHDRGLRYVAALPPEVQNYTSYVAALASAPANREGARRFLAFLAGAEARVILAAHGMD